jgi:hypothetical protein
MKTNVYLPHKLLQKYRIVSFTNTVEGITRIMVLPKNLFIRNIFARQLYIIFNSFLTGWFLNFFYVHCTLLNNASYAAFRFHCVGTVATLALAWLDFTLTQLDLILAYLDLIIYFLYIFFGGLECVGHSCAVVAHFLEMSEFEPRELP